MVETARWGLGYDGTFMITNGKAYDLQDWKLSFACLGDSNFTWGPSDVDTTWSGVQVRGCWWTPCVPSRWLAGALLRVCVSGRRLLGGALVEWEGSGHRAPCPRHPSDLPQASPSRR